MAIANDASVAALMTVNGVRIMALPLGTCLSLENMRRAAATWFGGATAWQHIQLTLVNQHLFEVLLHDEQIREITLELSEVLSVGVGAEDRSASSRGGVLARNHVEIERAAKTAAVMPNFLQTRSPIAGGKLLLPDHDYYGSAGAEADENESPNPPPTRFEVQSSADHPDESGSSRQEPFLVLNVAGAGRGRGSSAQAVAFANPGVDIYAVVDAQKSEYLSALHAIAKHFQKTTSRAVRYIGPQWKAQEQLLSSFYELLRSAPEAIRRDVPIMSVAVSIDAGAINPDVCDPIFLQANPDLVAASIKKARGRLAVHDDGSRDDIDKIFDLGLDRYIDSARRFPTERQIRENFGRESLMALDVLQGSTETEDTRSLRGEEEDPETSAYGESDAEKETAEERRRDLKERASVFKRTLSQDLLQDRCFVLSAAYRNGYILEACSEHDGNHPFLDDEDVVLAAVQSVGLALQYASERLRGKAEVIYAAVGQNGIAFGYASTALQRDLDVVRRAVEISSQAFFGAEIFDVPVLPAPEAARHHGDPSCQVSHGDNNLPSSTEPEDAHTAFVAACLQKEEYRDIVRIALRGDPGIFGEISPYIAPAVRTHTLFPGPLGDAIRSDPEFTLFVVSTEGYGNLIEDAINPTRAAVFAGIADAPWAYADLLTNEERPLPDSLLWDRELALLAFAGPLSSVHPARLCQTIYDHLPHEMRSDPKFALDAVERAPSLYTSCGAKIMQAFQGGAGGEHVEIDRRAFAENLAWAAVGRADDVLEVLPPKSSLARNRDFLARAFSWRQCAPVLGQFSLRNDLLPQAEKEELLNDRGLVRAAVEIDPENFPYASAQLRNDKDFVLEVLHTCPATIFFFLPEQLRDDKTFLLQILRLGPRYVNAAKNASVRLQNDPDVLLEVIGGPPLHFDDSRNVSLLGRGERLLYFENDAAARAGRDLLHLAVQRGFPLSSSSSSATSIREDLRKDPALLEIERLYHNSFRTKDAGGYRIPDAGKWKTASDVIDFYSQGQERADSALQFLEMLNDKGLLAKANK